jgi:hypothetical protein
MKNAQHRGWPRIFECHYEEIVFVSKKIEPSLNVNSRGANLGPGKKMRASKQFKLGVEKVIKLLTKAFSYYFTCCLFHNSQLNRPPSVLTFQYSLNDPEKIN